MKIEEYARQAEDLVRNAPEEKREKVAGQVLHMEQIVFIFTLVHAGKPRSQPGSFV